ncbi:MAG: cell wall-binding repeat-containing protein [Knoellia sp.]
MFSVRSAVSIAAVACVAATGLAAPSALAASSAANPSPAAKLASVERHAPNPASRPGADKSASKSSAAEAVELDRIAGSNRYLTPVEISKRHFPDGVWAEDGSPVEVVTVASGTNYPDALAGGPFAAGLGPLLLVPAAGTIPAGVTAEINRLSPDVIVILGGTGAVNAGVETQLNALADTVRLSGTNRYDTAATIAEATDGDLVDGADTVVLSSGEGFADSLSGGASAAVQSGVLMLTRPLGLPTETRDALVAIAPSNVQVLGGPLVVSDVVLDQVKAALPGATVTRVFGASRADTAAEVSKTTFPSGTSEEFLTNGWNYPDALAAAPLAWYWDASVLLTRPGCAPAGTIAEDTRLAPDFRTAIGGTLAVSDAALNLTPCP